jgi:hypothetical protein
VIVTDEVTMDVDLETTRQAQERNVVSQLVAR